MIATPIATLVKRYSFEEYCRYDDGTDTRYELEAGNLIRMNPPIGLHFLIAQRLERFLTAEIQKLQQPWLCVREAGLRTSFSKSRLPDLMVVEEADFMELIDQSLVFQKSPRLAVEIVSPESVTRDYRYKRSEYASIGVPEYWIIDPLEAKITLLIFNEGLYDETVFTGDRPIISPQFPELSFTAQTILKIDQN